MEMALTVTVPGAVTLAMCCKLCCLFQWFCLLLSCCRPPFLSWLYTMPVKGSWQMCSPARSVLLACAAFVPRMCAHVASPWPTSFTASALQMCVSKQVNVPQLKKADRALIDNEVAILQQIDHPHVMRCG